MGFIETARGILGDIRRAQESVQQAQESAEGQLVVGLSVVAHLGIANTVIPPFHRRYPRVKLRLVEGFLPTLDKDIREGLIDLFVGPVPDTIETADLTHTKLFDNERVVVARKGHPLADATTIADLRDALWLTTTITRDAEDELNSVFSRHNLPKPRLGGQAQTALSILTLMLHTDMLAMMPVQWVRSPLLSEWLQYIRLRESFRAPPIMLVHKAGLGLTPAGEYFAHLVERSSSQMFQV